MRLNVITACSRPQNLPALAESITAATCPPWDVHWHISFDLDQNHVGGHYPKNRLLEKIEDGWVFILDDDTLMHPDLLTAVTGKILDDDLAAVVVSQERTDGRILQAAPANLRVGHVDAGQVLLRRDVIGLERMPEVYVGDGLFIQSVLSGAAHVAFLPDVLSWHNRLDVVAA